MIIIRENGIEHEGTKQEIVLDLVRLLYSFKFIVDLSEEEIQRLERCFGKMIRHEDVTEITQEFNTEQRNKMIADLYKEVGIKKLEDK